MDKYYLWQMCLIFRFHDPENRISAKNCILFQ